MKNILLFAFLFISAFVNAQTYRIYGGEDYKVFFGKWASQYDSESIWNKYGDYGSKYSSKSIWNKYSEFGSKYNQYSPWNAYSSNPPALVDDSDNIVGYLTCSYKGDSKMRKLVKYIIENFDEVADDPSEFYKETIRKIW